MSGMLGGVTRGLKSLLPMGIGMAAAAALAKRFNIGDPIGASSTIAGEPWTPVQYGLTLAVGAAVQAFGPKLGLRGNLAEKAMEGALALAGAKLFFTVLVPKIPGVSNFLGADDDIEYDPATGQAWMMENGKRIALQGLVTASPMDGIVTASPLDGDGDNFGEAEDSNDVLSAYA